MLLRAASVARSRVQGHAAPAKLLSIGFALCAFMCTGHITSCQLFRFPSSLCFALLLCVLRHDHVASASQAWHLQASAACDLTADMVSTDPDSYMLQQCSAGYYGPSVALATTARSAPCASSTAPKGAMAGQAPSNANPAGELQLQFAKFSAPVNGRLLHTAGLTAVAGFC